MKSERAIFKNRFKNSFLLNYSILLREKKEQEREREREREREKERERKRKKGIPKTHSNHMNEEKLFQTLVRL